MAIHFNFCFHVYASANLNVIIAYAQNLTQIPQIVIASNVSAKYQKNSFL